MNAPTRSGLVVRDLNNMHEVRGSTLIATDIHKKEITIYLMEIWNIYGPKKVLHTHIFINCWIKIKYGMIIIYNMKLNVNLFI